MRTLTVLLLVGIVAFTTIAVVLGTYFFVDRPLLVSDTAEVSYVFIVSNETGFDVARDALRMGMVSSDVRSKREITVVHPFASHVHVRVRGPGRTILYPEKPVYVLQNGSVDVPFFVAPTNTTPYGEYSGVVKFYFT